MKRCVLVLLLIGFASARLSAQQSQNSISVQGRLTSTEAVSGISVEIYANGVLVSTASPIDMLPDKNGVFTAYISGFDSLVFQIPAGLFEISFKKDDVEIARTPLTAVAFALAVRGIKVGDNIIGVSGNVGVGTIEPEKKLTVIGDVLIDGDLYARNFIGAVMFFAGTTCPTGWILANGANLPPTGPYAGLFNYLKYTYGQVGENFVLPNMVDGSFIRGTGGNAASIGTKQLDAFKSHTHTLPRRSGTGYAGQVSAMGNSLWWPIESYPAGDTETRPLNYAMTPCIKY